jgi:hypothetical protein
VHKFASGRRGHQRLTHVASRSFNLYSQGRQRTSRLCRFVFIPQHSSRRLTKCALRDLQRRGVFFKLVFYTFPYFARHYGKSRAKKTRATRFSCSRSFSPVLGANFPYYHLFWACKLCLKCRTDAACSALVARFRLLFIHLLNPDRYPQWGNSLMNIDFDGS